MAKKVELTEGEKLSCATAAELAGIKPEEAERRYANAKAKWDRILAPHIEAIRRSQILTAEDYAVLINCRGECD
ncbi:MAG TPA: hypothetical protein VI953_02735 [Candidatus Paceibacterota bacterium]